MEHSKWRAALYNSMNIPARLFACPARNAAVPVNIENRMIERYGAEMRLPDMRQEIAQCDRRGQMLDMCGVHYLGLARPS